MYIVLAFLFGLCPALIALFVVVRRLRAIQVRADQLESRFLAVVDGFGIGLSVWSQDRLMQCNERFTQFYPGVPLNPGLVWEDLMRFTVTRGLVRVSENEVESWICDHVERFRGSAREVVRMADERWLEIRSVLTDHGDTLVLFSDVSEVHDVRKTLSHAGARLEQQANALVLFRRTVEIAGESRSFENAVDQVLAAVCEWSGWPVGHAYRVSGNEEQIASMGVWCMPTAGTFESFRAMVENEDSRKGDGVAGRSLQSESVFWIANVAVDPTMSDTRRDVMPGIRGACTVPVKSCGRVVAVLEFLAYEQLSPVTSTTQLLEGVADVLGWAFERQTPRSHQL